MGRSRLWPLVGTVLLFLVWQAESARGMVVLSEVMFDPAGSEFYDEFVEVFNTSETESVDLEGWTIGDGSEDDGIVAVGEGTVLGPRQFGLILDPGYLERSTTYDPLPEDALVLMIDDGAFGKGGWSNGTSEPVILRDAYGDTVAMYVYSVGNPPGRSDEKIRPEGGDDPENWANSEVDGGTPGRRNSVFMEHMPTETDLSAFPNPFDERTILSYRVPARTATVNLWIFDGQGRRIRRLLNARPSGAERSVIWDGMDDEGIRVKMGIYILYLEALDARQGVVHTAKRTVVHYTD